MFVKLRIILNLEYRKIILTNKQLILIKLLIIVNFVILNFVRNLSIVDLMAIVNNHTPKNVAIVGIIKYTKIITLRKSINGKSRMATIRW